MSLQLYSQIPGTQVKRDANLSNATIQCDPSALYPLGATQGGVLLNKENLAGKIAVEHDLCNLDVNNLTVNGVLVAKGPAEVCDIVCPADFTVTAGINIIETATAGSMSLNAPVGDIVGNAINVELTASTGNVNVACGGDMGLEAVNDMGLEALNDMVLVAGNDTTITAVRDMVLAAGRDMSLNADNQVKLAGNTQGVQMAFDAATDTDVLRMTNLNVNSVGAANAQTVTANAVTGTITMLANTVINGGDFISCTLTNNKIATNSTVLCSVNIAGNQSERIFINGGGTAASSYEFVLTNLGASPANDYASSATNRIVISFLVINPAL